MGMVYFSVNDNILQEVCVNQGRTTRYMQATRLHIHLSCSALNIKSNSKANVPAPCHRTR